MRVTVKLFASFREAAGENEAMLEVEQGTTVGELWSAIVERHRRLAPLSASAAMALNGRYATADSSLSEGDVVAFLPPVSGG
jgi:molybdopterin converting factor subunit 1